MARTSSAHLSNGYLHSTSTRSFADLPHNNPCAQCGRLIALPEWVESRENGTAYLWRCSACDYHFEAFAFARDADHGHGALAA